MTTPSKHPKTGLLAAQESLPHANTYQLSAGAAGFARDANFLGFFFSTGGASPPLAALVALLGFLFAGAAGFTGFGTYFFFAGCAVDDDVCAA